MRLWAVGADCLPDLVLGQAADHGWSHYERNDQRGQHAQNPPQGDVLENEKTVMKLAQVLEQAKQHDHALRPVCEVCRCPAAPPPPVPCACCANLLSIR